MEAPLSPHKDKTIVFRQQYISYSSKAGSRLEFLLPVSISTIRRVITAIRMQAHRHKVAPAAKNSRE